MPSSGKIVASTSCSPAVKRTHRKRLDLVALLAEAPLGEFVRDAAIEEPHGDGLRRIREKMQRDVVMRGRRAGEQRTHQSRLELREQAHRFERGAAHRNQFARVSVWHEQALMLGERFLDLGVLRQHGEIGDSEAFRGLALGETVVLVAMLDHQARGLARDRVAHHFAPDGSARHQKIGSSYCCVGTVPSVEPGPATPAGRCSARKYSNWAGDSSPNS